MLGYLSKEKDLSKDSQSITNPNQVKKSCTGGSLKVIGFGSAPKSFLLSPSPHRGRHYWVPSTQRLFGGQIVGQALVAAAKSVSEDVHVHSLHCYFVRKGKPTPPYPTPAQVAQQKNSGLEGWGWWLRRKRERRGGERDGEVSWLPSGEPRGRRPGTRKNLKPSSCWHTWYLLVLNASQWVFCPLSFTHRLVPVLVLVPQRSPGISAGSLEKRPAWESRDLWSRWSFVTDLLGALECWVLDEHSSSPPPSSHLKNAGGPGPSEIVLAYNSGIKSKKEQSPCSFEKHKNLTPKQMLPILRVSAYCVVPSTEKNLCNFMKCDLY